MLVSILRPRLKSLSQGTTPQATINMHHNTKRNKAISTENNETLDIEDEDARESRISGVLSRLNTASSQLNSPQPPTSFVFGERGPHGTDAPSELLSRVQAFLPQLEASNRALLRRAQEDPSSVDIENVEECEEHYIEMNLGLGVFEDRSKASTTSNDMSDSDSDSSNTSSSCSDSDSESSDGSSIIDFEVFTSTPGSRPIKPLPKRGSHPGIVVLDNSSGS